MPSELPAYGKGIARARNATVRWAGMPIGVVGEVERSLPTLVVRPFWRAA